MKTVTSLFTGAASAIVHLLRRNRSASPTQSEPAAAVDDRAEREARHQEVEEHGTELLDRRVDLDGRRGTLGGDSGVLDAFERLDARYRSGEISSDEFEAEKIRLLGG